MLRLAGLQKQFGDVVAVKRFDLEVEPGEFVTLLGPSGSGKTTVLRMIAGLLDPTNGRILIGHEDVTRTPAQKRNIGLVFQSYALFPNMDVRQNISFPLKVRKWSTKEINHRVDELLEMVGLLHRKRHLPDELSGGEKQRVALARALAFRPPLLLLDEPLSALDAKVRVALRSSLKEIQQTTGVTTLMVTHDQEEALELADRIVVMNHGGIEQIDSPADIYYDPRTAFTAQFIGSVTPIETKVESVSARSRSESITTLVWEGGRFQWLVRHEHVKPGSPRTVYVRPETVEVSARHMDGWTAATVRHITFTGALTRLQLSVGNSALLADTMSHLATSIDVGMKVYVRIIDPRLQQTSLSGQMNPMVLEVDEA